MKQKITYSAKLKQNVNGNKLIKPSKKMAEEEVKTASFIHSASASL